MSHQQPNLRPKRLGAPGSAEGFPPSGTALCTEADGLRTRRQGGPSPPTQSSTTLELLQLVRGASTPTS